MPPKNNLLDVPGLKVGHATDLEHGTGATAIIFEKLCTAGVNVCGFATGTREIEVCRPEHSTAGISAFCLAGGSCFGLGAADGVLKYCEEKGVGFQFGSIVVPIVPSAIVFDLLFKSSAVRPDAAMGYQACLNAKPDVMEQGSVGAGTGVCVGQVFAMASATKSGLGSASMVLNDGLVVAALAVVNNLGDVLDYRTGSILAGARDPKTNQLLNSTRFFAGMNRGFEFAPPRNTNLGVVCTNAKLDKSGAHKLAKMAEAGFGRTLSPFHSTFDGDIIFAVSAGELSSEINRLGILAAEVLARAVNNAVLNADGLGVIPALKDLKPELVRSRKES
jgi:L-aminopeptidase/D-esterase-like protein